MHVSLTSRRALCRAAFLATSGLILASSLTTAQAGNPTPSPDQQYELGPDSKPRPGVPEGRVTEFTLDDSYEYDTLSDQYASFLLTEILPEARKHVRLSDDPARRGIAGRSSGGIGAFTVAWRRPDQFRKVFSANGSFVNIRGGGAYPDLIRQEARRPARVPARWDQ